MPDNITQLGVSGLTLGILYFVVKNFVKTINKKDEHIERLTEKFIDMGKQNIESHLGLTKSIDANTEATRQAKESSKKDNDNLSKLILKLIKTKEVK